MQKIHAAITAVGGYVPEYVLTNAELEKMMDTTDEWIQQRSGIRERRFAKPGIGPADLALNAATDAALNLEHAQFALHEAKDHFQPLDRHPREPPGGNDRQRGVAAQHRAIGRPPQAGIGT